MIARSNIGSPEAAKYMREVEREMDRLEPVVKPIRVCEVIAAVCEEGRVDISDLFSSSRHKAIAMASRACTVCLRDLCCRSFPEIARDMHSRNHSTHVSRYHRAKDSETEDLIARVKLRVAANRNSEGGR